MSIRTRLSFVGFAAALFCFGCETPPDSWNVTPAKVAWHTPPKDTGQEQETEKDTGMDSATAEEWETETETGNQEDTETQTEKDTSTKKSCRESIMCLVQNSANPMSCLTEADDEAKQLLMGLIVCLMQNGCLTDISDITGLSTCAMSKCGKEFMACMADS